MKRKVTLIIAAAALVGSLIVGGTLAWLTDTETATNVVTVGSVDVQITESCPTNPGDYTATPSEAEKGVVYGGIEANTAISKNPLITYVGESDAYIRYRVIVKDLDKNIELSADEMKEIMTFWKGSGQSAENVSMNILFGSDNDDGWIYSTTRYQPNTAVPSGKSITGKSDNELDAERLFTEVRFETFGNEMMNRNFDIIIQADAIQADNLPDTNGNGTIDLDDIKSAFTTVEIQPRNN